MLTKKKLLEVKKKLDKNAVGLIFQVRNWRVKIKVTPNTINICLFHLICLTHWFVCSFWQNGLSAFRIRVSQRCWKPFKLIARCCIDQFTWTFGQRQFRSVSNFCSVIARQIEMSILSVMNRSVRVVWDSTHFSQL